ncbi:MAG: deoxyribose-phosphate aldolase [Ruminococcus sp.]|nr:deoxyribose-phosphate aldolase [Ruminococcus sp.]
MDIKDILSKVDHTLLSQTATREVIRQVCEDGIRYSCASVCIPPSYVKEAKSFVGNKIKICTVIGFPNGYQTTSVKCFETRDAVENGADEIDMVINIGWLKDKRYDEILGEINSVKAACQGRILKVIIETCLLTDDEKIKMCELINASDADYIKTSTGFSKAGATVEDIKLFCDHINSDKKIKAAGGIASLEDAEVFLSIGASRLGTSRVVKLAKNL